jgi:hypothetical protein
VGFRQLLNRATKSESATLTELAELEAVPEEGGTCIRPFAGRTRMCDTAPRSSAHADKTATPEVQPAPKSVAKIEKKSTRPPSYVWRSQASLDRGSEAVRFANKQF